MLDAGRAGGVPGLLLFTAFAMAPFFHLWKRRRLAVALPALAMYAIVLLCMQALSDTNFKVFWALWAILIAMSADPNWPEREQATLPSPPNRHPVRPQGAPSR
jgi:hypothetical protein